MNHWKDLTHKSQLLMNQTLAGCALLLPIQSKYWINTSMATVKYHLQIFVHNLIIIYEVRLHHWYQNQPHLQHQIKVTLVSSTTIQTRIYICHFCVWTESEWCDKSLHSHYNVWSCLHCKVNVSIITQCRPPWWLKWECSCFVTLHRVTWLQCRPV